MSSPSSRVIGTLVVVVLKANHLPNKRHIGKQDPYCVVSVNGDKRRTKAIKRGGQHPEWDEEIRFEIQEAVEQETLNEDGTPPPLPPKAGRSMKNVNIEGGKTMKIACYADDTREPDFIGEADVDLTEVLTKGECDEWFTLMNKDKFSGKVYLELTFWSNEPAPEKKPSTKTIIAKNDKDYGGPGSFFASNDVASIPPTLRTGQQSRTASTSVVYDHPRRQSDSVAPHSMRSTSLAQLDLYSPPYERGNQTATIDNITNDFAELGVAEPRRRESYPPPQGGFGPRPSMSQPSHIYDPSLSDPASIYRRPLTPPGQGSLHHRNSVPASYHMPYQPQYETAPPSSYNPAPPARGPRYSIPSTSSGFVSVPNSTSSGFGPLGSEPPGFGAPLSHTPAPSVYSHFNQSFPPASQTPIPPHPPAGSFSPQPFTPQHSYVYGPSPTPLPGPPPHLGYTPSGSPSHDIVQSHLPNGPLPPSAPPSTGASRPLPQPQVYASQHAQPNYALGSPHEHAGHFSPPVSSFNYQNVPPPPPLPSNEPLSSLPPQSSGFNSQPLPIPPPPPIDYQQNTPAPVLDYQSPAHPVYPGPPPPPPPVPQAYPQSSWA